MATDHNFRIKNGLEVGGQLIVNSSGALVVSSVQSSLNFVDNAKAIFGTGSDFEIYHDQDGPSYIRDRGSSDLVFTSNGSGFKFRNDNSTEILADLQLNGAVTLYYDNAAKLATTSSGVTVTGDLTANAENAELQLIDTSSGNTTSILSNNFDTFIQADGRIFFRAGGSSDNIIQLTSGGDVAFYEDTGTNTNLVWDSSESRLQHKDNVRATFGDSSDLQIYHDGTHSYIDSTTGSLYIRTGNTLQFKNQSGSETLATFAVNGAATLFHDNISRLATTSSGIVIPNSGNTIGWSTLANAGVLIGSTSAGIGIDNNEIMAKGVGSMYIGTGDTGDVVFRTNGTSARLTVKSDGDVEVHNSLDVGADLNVTGDLNITGDINSVSVTDLDIIDKTITLGVGGTASANDGGGIIINGANAEFIWDNTNTQMTLNKDLKFTADQKLRFGNTYFYRSGDSNFLHFYAPSGLIPHHTTASNNASLGASSFRWDGVFSTTGNFSGLVSAERLEVTTANATINSGHPSMRRGSSGEMFLDAPGDIIMHIDSNNNNTDRRFRVRKDTAGSTDLFSVDESADTRTGGKLYLSGTTANYQSSDGNYLRNTTEHGYIKIGPGNAAHAHFLTDRSNFYFNTELTVNTGVVGSYDEDLYLRRARTTSTGQLQLGRGTFSGNTASASDLDLSHTIIGGFTANSAFENAYRHFYVPGLSPNQLAGANKKFTVTSTKNGSNFSLGGNMFSARGDFSSATVVAGTTDTIIITIVGIQLSYGQHYGIQFGNDSFRAKDIKIERSTDSGSTWSTIYDVDDFPLAVVNHYHGGNGTSTNAVRYTLTNFASTGLRINQLFAYDYSESGTYFSEKNRDENITANWTWRDMSKAQFGDNADMTLYHDGTNSIINNQQGTLYIDQNVNDGNLILRSDNGSGGLSEYIVLDGGTGSTILKSYGAEKAKTQSWGLLVTGTLNADQLHIGQGSSDLISVHNDGTFTSTYRNNTGGVLDRRYADHGNDGTTVEYNARVGMDGNFTSVGNFSAHDFRLRTNNLDRMTVDGAGNIGIGLTNPSSLLHIYEDATSLNNTTTDLLKLEGNIVDFGDTPSAIALAFKFQDGNNNTNEARIRMATVNDTDYGDNDEAASNLIFSTTNGGTEADKMIITGRGDIGIGTTNPGHKLHVVGTNNTTPFSIDIGAAASYNFKANSNSTYVTTFNMDADGLTIGHDSGYRELALQTDDTNRLVISPTGNTTLSGNLTVQGADVDIASIIRHIGDTNTYFGFHGNDLWRVVTGGVERFEIGNTGVRVNDGGNDVDFTIESNNNANMFYLDGTNDRVGIGTSTPLYPLHVAGSIYSNGGNVFVDSNQKFIWGNSQQWIRSVNDGSMYFATAGVERLELQNDGDLVVSGDIYIGAEHINFKTNGNSTKPNFLGHRSATDLNNRNFTTEGGFSYTTFEGSTSNKPSHSSNNANGVITINTHSGSYNHQLAFTNQGNIAQRSRDGGGYTSWYNLITDRVPNAPSITSTTVVNETIEIVFAASTSSGHVAATSYEVWSDGGTGDFSLIAKIPTQDIASSMSVVDSSFDDSGTIAYRIYAIKHGVYSTAATTSRAFSMPSLDVSSMSVIPDTNSFHIQYELPDTRFLDHVEIYKDAETTSGALARSGASLIYTGRNPSYKYNIGSNDMEKYHQFWVEVVTV